MLAGWLAGPYSTPWRQFSVRICSVFDGFLINLFVDLLDILSNGNRDENRDENQDKTVRKTTKTVTKMDENRHGNG